MKIISGIRDICGEYDAFILDVWGVVFDGTKIFPHVNDFLEQIKGQEKLVTLLSNSSRSGKTILEVLGNAGLNVSNIAFAQTSGDAAMSDIKHFISKESGKNKKLYYMCAEENKDLFDGTPIQLTSDISDADFIAVSVFVAEDSPYSHLIDVLQKAAKRKLPMLCLNPDKMSLHGNKKRLCAGFFAEKYQEFGGDVKFYGKPYPAIYEAVFSRLVPFGLENKGRFVMIGDSMETDILGAKNVSIDSVLVKTGVSAKQLEEQFGSSWHSKVQSIYKCTPTFLVDELKW